MSKRSRRTRRVYNKHERENQWKRDYPEAFRKENRRKKKLSRHHLLNRCRQGTDCDENILMLTLEHHREWHRLFKNSDPEYIIAVLTRMMRMKHYREGV